MKILRVSFIVPAWNEELLLPRALEAIHRAARHAELDYEVIVSDDASTDRTPDIALAHGARVVTCNNRQIGATRNCGARVAEGNLLFFVDADTLVTPETIRGAVEAVENGATYGGADITWDGPIPFMSRAMLRATLFSYRFFKLAAGAFLFCTREAFDRVNGFDETIFATEEYDLSRRLAKVGRYVWLRQQVVTSGRKLRAHSFAELLRESIQMSMGGMKSVRNRDRLGLCTTIAEATRIHPLTYLSRPTRLKGPEVGWWRGSPQARGTVLPVPPENASMRRPCRSRKCRAAPPGTTRGPF